MYKLQKIVKTSIKRNESVEGEPIELKIERITNNKEPIVDGAPPIYTERKDGVVDAYNIRTDRWDLAVDAMDKVDAQHKAKREARHYGQKKEDGKAESTQGQGGEQGAQTTTE